MSDFWLAILVYQFYWIVEANHDNVLRIKNNTIYGLMRLVSKWVPDYVPDYDTEAERTSKWHKLDWADHAGLALLVGYLIYHSWNMGLFAVIVGIQRLITLNIGIQWLIGRRGWKLFTLGDSGLEGKFKGLEWLYYLLASILLVIAFLVLKIFIPLHYK